MTTAPVAVDTVVDVPEITPVELITPDALDTAGLDPDITIVRTVAPEAELTVLDEPTSDALRLRVPFASSVSASAWPEIEYIVPLGAAGITGRPGPRQTLPERLI